jgi:hypothetical protein
MMTAALLAAMVVILGPADLSYVETGTGATRTVPLPGPARAVFVAPDGRVLLPAAELDETWVVEDGRPLERWAGRTAPLFFDEVDRAWVLFAGELALVSYPERLVLRQVELDGLGRVRAAAVSRDGRLVAVLPDEALDLRLWLLVPEDSRPQRPVRLPRVGRVVAVSPEAELVAVGLEGSGVVLVTPEAPDLPVLIETPGQVESVAFDAEAKSLVLGCRLGDGGLLLGVRAELRPGKPVKELFRMSLRVFPSQILVGGGEVLALCNDRLLVLTRGGRKLVRELEAPAARSVALVPAATRSLLPAWSDR